ncbi:MAG TPA: radical SAM protein [Candidatus Saccharimonadales bacterium]|nr:radical SAM protein [Candidatus Saccharimonadales bacterium]
MKIKMILPALTEATSPYFRPIKYSLFPPLGLATLAAFCGDGDEITIQDEHVETLDLDDEPDVVVIQVYITSARRAYELADHYRRRGAHVCLGGLHVTSLPEEARAHAGTIFIGPGEDTWPRFLRDYRSGCPSPEYRSTLRTLEGLPPIRRDLIKRHLYFVPNSIVVSRGCPHVCDFCYKEAFFEGGAGFYTQSVDAALAEIDRLPGRHLYFLDDHLFGHPRFAAALFDGMRGMGRLWQAAATVSSILRPGLLEKAAACGLRSLFVGFETLDREALRRQRKLQNLHGDYAAAVRRLHEHGVMVNASFVFGMDGEDSGVFDRTVAWAIEQGIETATFHILTPYPGTALHRRMQAAGRILHSDWDLYDTRHVVYRPMGLRPDEIESGYWRAYREFYRWGSILRGARHKPDVKGLLRHAAYAAGWKKFEWLWDAIIRGQRLIHTLPLLETVLSEFGRRGSGERLGASSGTGPRSRNGTVVPTETRLHEGGQEAPGLCRTAAGYLTSSSGSRCRGRPGRW